MTGTRFCAVTGVWAVVRAHRHAESLSIWVRVVVPPPHVRRVFTLTGASDMLMLYPDLDAALPRRRNPTGRPAPQLPEAAPGTADRPG